MSRIALAVFLRKQEPRVAGAALMTLGSCVRRGTIQAARGGCS